MIFCDGSECLSVKHKCYAALFFLFLCDTLINFYLY